MLKYQAEAEGLQRLLESKARGYQKLVDSVSGDTQAAATLLLIEKLQELVGAQVEAISKLKIDKITVWDSGNGSGNSTTANFISGLVKSVPPLQELAGMAGVELPEYLGKMVEEAKQSDRPSVIDGETDTPMAD